MAIPAIVAGLLAGYTVGAVVTALAVAHDDAPLERSAPAAAEPHTSQAGACARGPRRARDMSRCWRALDRNRILSSPR
ncbi:MAG: hypothetical protein M3Y51_07985, partial [Actinomycetota bacterium]|nr:hypothetical protein [Actinomycetota bacterium]